MLRSVARLTGLFVNALDGDIGSVDQLLLEDRLWKIRYLVVKVGGMLGTRRVLLTPATFIGPTTEGFTVKVTVAQVLASPPIDTAQPITRAVEQELHDHYAWSYYWDLPPSQSTGLLPGFTYPPSIIEQVRIQAEEEEHKLRAVEGSHLRATKEMTSYHLTTPQGRHGRVHDLLLDDSRWEVRFLIVMKDTVLHRNPTALPITRVRSIDAATATIGVEVMFDLIRTAPEYHPNQPFTQEDERRAIMHFEETGPLQGTSR